MAHCSPLVRVLLAFDVGRSPANSCRVLAFFRILADLEKKIGVAWTRVEEARAVDFHF